MKTRRAKSIFERFAEHCFDYCNHSFWHGLTRIILSALFGVALPLAAYPAQAYPIPIVTDPDFMGTRTGFPNIKAEKATVIGLPYDVLVIRYASKTFDDKERLVREVYDLLFKKYSDVQWAKTGIYVAVITYRIPNPMKPTKYKGFVFLRLPSQRWAKRPIAASELGRLVPGIQT